MLQFLGLVDIFHELPEIFHELPEIFHEPAVIFHELAVIFHESAEIFREPPRDLSRTGGDLSRRAGDPWRERGDDHPHATLRSIPARPVPGRVAEFPSRDLHGPNLARCGESTFGDGSVAGGPAGGTFRSAFGCVPTGPADFDFRRLRLSMSTMMNARNMTTTTPIRKFFAVIVNGIQTWWISIRSDSGRNWRSKFGSNGRDLVPP